MTSSDEVAWRRHPNGDTNRDSRVASLSHTRAAASLSQSATDGLVELDLSLPTATDDAVAAGSLVLPRRPQSAGGCHGFNKPCQDIVPTQVYILPHREGVPVRLSMPFRPSTAGQEELRNHRACAVGVKSRSARCGTYPSRAQPRPFESKRPAGRCQDLGVRLDSVPLATQQQQQQQKQLGDGPSATNTSRNRKARQQCSVTPCHPNRICTGGVHSATQQQQQPDDPSAMSTGGSKKCGKLSAATSSAHPNRTRIVGGVRSQIENDPCHHQAPTSARPNKTRIIGGVCSHVGNDPCAKRPSKAPLTARSSARQRRHPKAFLTVQARDIVLAVRPRDNRAKSCKPGAPRPPFKPRPLSAPARGRAIRRAVERCGHNLPATPELSYGGTRFLRQWDGASRRQRGEILTALADQLLVVGGAGDGSYDGQLAASQGGGPCDEQQQQQQQQQQPSAHVDVQSSNEIIKKRREGARRELPSGQRVIKLEVTCTPPVEFASSSAALNVLGNSGTAFNVFDPTDSKKHRPRHHCWGYQAGTTAKPKGTIETADDYADGMGFIELLGAHAGLLVTRISSYLRTLHSCGHAIGSCLRVTTLLAESTFEPSRSGGEGGSNGNGGDSGGGGGSCSGNYSIATSLAQQLSTPGIIRVALETVALETPVVSKPMTNPASTSETKPNPKLEAKLAAKPANPKLVFEPENKTAAKPEAKTVAKPAAMAEPFMKRKNTRTRKPSSPPEEENNRAQALRLLLALVRAGGRQIKEHLTCSSSMFIPRTERSGDVLGPILVALRRPRCAVETRKAAGNLLVELGVGNPAGSGKVWNTVLSIVGQETCRKAQVLGCDVARELLLSTLGAGCSSSNSSSGGVGYRESCFMWSQEHRLPPEVLLVPSVLTLSLSNCSATREAAGELAAFLANFSGSCCYLLVAGLTGLLETISGMKRSTSVAWHQRHHPPPRGEATTTKYRADDEVELRCETNTTKPRGEDDLLEMTWSEFHQRNYQRVAEIRGQGGNTYRLNEAGYFREVQYENSGGGINNSRQSDTNTDNGFGDGKEAARGGKADSGRWSVASEAEKPFDGKPTRLATGSTDIDNHVIRAAEMLRRICSCRRGVHVCLALLSALAPLAVLDLVVNPGRTTELLPGTEKNEKPAQDAAGEDTFLTRPRTTPDECATRMATNGRASFAREEEDVQTEEARAGGTKKCENRDHEAPHPGRGMENNFIQDGRAISGHTKTGPRQAYFLALAEMLLVMYRLDQGCIFTTVSTDQVIPATAGTSRSATLKPLSPTIENDHGSPTPKPPPFPLDITDDDSTLEREGQTRGASSSDILELKRMISAALDGCPRLSSSLRIGDAAALAREFSVSADDCRANREEILTLQKNVFVLTNRLCGARPRPPADDENENLQQGSLPDAYMEDKGGHSSIAGG